MNRIDPRKMLGLGFLLNAVTLYWMGGLNLQAGFWDIFWPQFVQGVGLGLLFVPAHDRGDGPDRAQGHGSRDEPVQPAAEHRRRGGIARHPDDAGARPPGALQRARRARQRLRAADAD